MSFEYLSDEELNNLIMDVEQNDMVTAPPNIQGSILEELDELVRYSVELPQKSQGDKVVEFRRYRLRVIAAVAAVVAFVMIVPGFTRAIPKEDSANLIDISITDRGWLKDIASSHYISDFINMR